MRILIRLQIILEILNEQYISSSLQVFLGVSLRFLLGALFALNF